MSQQVWYMCMQQDHSTAFDYANASLAMATAFASIMATAGSFGHFKWELATPDPKKKKKIGHHARPMRASATAPLLTPNDCQPTTHKPTSTSVLPTTTRHFLPCTTLSAPRGTGSP